MVKLMWWRFLSFSVVSRTVNLKANHAELYRMLPSCRRRVEVFEICRLQIFYSAVKLYTSLRAHSHGTQETLRFADSITTNTAIFWTNRQNSCVASYSYIFSMKYWGIASLIFLWTHYIFMSLWNNKDSQDKLNIHFCHPSEVDHIK